MFYRMVEKASRRWYGNPDCPATPIVSYIEAKGSLLERNSWLQGKAQTPKNPQHLRR